MTNIVLFPAHPPNCPVCRGTRQVRFCSVRPNAAGDVVADRLGEPRPCIPLPIWSPSSKSLPDGVA